MNSNASQPRQLTPEQLARLPVTSEATIDQEYLDSNRHMNVSWYLHLFNQATGGMHKWLGFDWSRFKEQGGGTFILEGHVRYLAEVLVGQHVTLRTRLVGRTPKRMHFLHFMFNDNNQTLAATYEKVLAYMDLGARRMAPYPEAIARRLDEVLAEHQALDWEPPVCGVMQA